MTMVSHEVPIEPTLEVIPAGPNSVPAEFFENVNNALRELRAPLGSSVFFELVHDQIQYCRISTGPIGAHNTRNVAPNKAEILHDAMLPLIEFLPAEADLSSVQATTVRSIVKPGMSQRTAFARIHTDPLNTLITANAMPTEKLIIGKRPLRSD